MVLNMTIGLSTAPVGTSLFIAASITKTEIQTTGRGMLPFLAACILILITYFPVFILWIPNLVMDYHVPQAGGTSGGKEKPVLF